MLSILRFFYILFILLFIIIVNITYSQKNKHENNFGSIEFSNRTDTSVLVEFNPSGTQTVIFILKPFSSDFKAPEQLDNLPKPQNTYDISSISLETQKNFVLFVYNSNNPYKFSISGLKPESRYQIALYFPDQKKSKDKVVLIPFNTLAKEPDKQAKIPAFSKIETNSITLKIKNGSGKQRILIVKENDTSDVPTDGTEYRPNLDFGKGEEVSSSFAVYGSDKINEGLITVKNLKSSTKYCFMVCEFNGTGEFVNYLTQKVPNVNLIFRSTKLEPPNALPATEVSKTSFIANWEITQGVYTYLLDVALDADFVNILSDYSNVDIGVINSFKIEDLPSNEKVFYYRLRAVGESGESDYSNIIKIVKK
jgi:hypothetical protein